MEPLSRLDTVPRLHGQRLQQKCFLCSETSLLQCALVVVQELPPGELGDQAVASGQLPAASLCIHELENERDGVCQPTRSTLHDTLVLEGVPQP